MSKTAFSWLMLPLLLLAACGESNSTGNDAVTAKLPPAEVAGERPQEGVKPIELVPDQSAEDKKNPATEPADAGTPTRSGYTSLDPSSCKPLEANADEAAVSRHRCSGSMDYALETSDGDGRQDLAIVSADGQRSELALSKLFTQARLGKTAEWRGDDSGKPRALIVRVNAPATSKSKGSISNLIVTRLAAPPCIVAVIPQGPRQNEKARAIADGKLLDCMKD